MSAELKDVMEQLGRTFEEFKGEHNRQIQELKEGRDDVVTREKIDKLNDAVLQLQEAKDAMELRLSRPQVPTAGSDADAQHKAFKQFEIEVKALAMARQAPPPAVSMDDFVAYKSAFNNMLRKGDVAVLTDAERKAMQVGVDSDGGYLVPADTSGKIVQRIWEVSPLRGICNVMSISSDRLEGFEDLDEASGGWVSEVGTRSDSDTPQVGKYEIVAHEMYSQPSATQKMLDDGAIDVEAWLAGKVANKFARIESAAFHTGTGVGQARGFTTYTTAATADGSRAWGQLEHVVTGANGAFHTTQADPLFDLIAAFKPGYLLNANWLATRACLAAIRKFKTTTAGEYLWRPGLERGQPSTLLEYPVVISQDMPAHTTTGNLGMALGDFREGYTIVDRLGIRTLRDPYTNKPYVRFYTIKRTGGGVVNFEAIKFIKFST